MRDGIVFNQISKDIWYLLKFLKIFWSSRLFLWTIRTNTLCRDHLALHREGTSTSKKEGNIIETMSSFPLLEFWLRRPWRKRICVTLSVQFPLLPTVVLLCTELWEPAQTGVCKGSRTDCHLRDSVFSVYSQALWTANSMDQRGDKLIYIREILIPLLTCHISSTIQKQLISLALCCRSPMEDLEGTEAKA